MKKEQSMLAINGNGLFPGINDMLQGVANTYSALLGEEISPRRTIHILNAQAAFLCLLLGGGGSIVLSMLSVAWFVAALLRCREAA